jgi:hypothetical protein
MKRTLTIALFSLGAIALFGCPVYSGGGGGPQPFPGGNCLSNADCPSGYYCTANNTCSAFGGSCSSPSQCPSGENCGSDNQCHGGDCSTSGCPSGYICNLANEVAQCVSNGDAGSGGDSGFSGCTSDSECANVDGGSGSLCLNGQCIAPANQCSDATQCTNNEQCVQGACTPACSASQPCPTGYSCDTNNDVCTGNPTPCDEGNAGGVCGSGLTCVEQHCVPDCGPGGTCSTGLICVDNGCIPNQQPQFICSVDGSQGDGGAGTCAVGSICLHHNCYISCEPDAGANACKTADQFNICKQVSTSMGTYNVCGSNSNLGNECDPTQGQNCTSPEICIDGYCR